MALLPSGSVIAVVWSGRPRHDHTPVRGGECCHLSTAPAIKKNADRFRQSRAGQEAVDADGTIQNDEQNDPYHRKDERDRRNDRCHAGNVHPLEHFHRQRPLSEAGEEQCERHIVERQDEG